MKSLIVLKNCFQKKNTYLNYFFILGKKMFLLISGTKIEKENPSTTFICRYDVIH